MLTHAPRVQTTRLEARGVRCRPRRFWPSVWSRGCKTAGVSAPDVLRAERWRYELCRVRFEVPESSEPDCISDPTFCDRRHRSEQNRTFSQSRAHFLRQANGRWHTEHILVGRCGLECAIASTEARGPASVPYHSSQQEREYPRQRLPRKHI